MSIDKLRALFEKERSLIMTTNILEYIQSIQNSLRHEFIVYESISNKDQGIDTRDKAIDCIIEILRSFKENK